MILTMRNNSVADMKLAVSKTRPIVLLLKMPLPTVMSINAGPGFTQQFISLAAEPKDIFLLSTAFLMTMLPVGYPPKKEEINSATYKSFLSNFSGIAVANKNNTSAVSGNSEGIISCAQFISPFTAPFVAASG